MGRMVANVSWGKDSTAMLLRFLDERWPLDGVLFYDTGMEFEAVYSVRDGVLPMLAHRGIRYRELRPPRPMWYDMLCKPVNVGKPTEHVGYGWCGGPCRWGTSTKTRVLDGAAGDADTVLVGIAADEVRRVKDDPRMRYPLVEWGMSEADCLAYCRDRGIDWVEDGVRLYDVLDRVSCWCCRNKNMRELAAMREHLPRYYSMLQALERANGQMKRGGPLEAAMEGSE